jgi:hypothetical protein
MTPGTHVNEEKPTTYFNKPWMDNLDQDLLYRYWMSKGCQGTLKTKAFGLTLYHIPTWAGVFTVARHNTICRMEPAR